MTQRRKNQPVCKRAGAPFCQPRRNGNKTPLEAGAPLPAGKPARIRRSPAPTPASESQRAAGAGPDYSGLTIYLREIRRIPRLTRAEELALVVRCRQGDEAARERLITANLRLVVAVARDYEGFGLPLLDLISEGNIGLMKAVDRFEPHGRARLTTYALWWIRAGVARAVQQHARIIRLPVNLIEKWGQIRRAEATLRHKLGRTPTDEEVAGHARCSAKRLALIRRAVACHASLDSPLGDFDASHCLADLIPDETICSSPEKMDQESAFVALDDCLAKLAALEAAVIARRFGLKETNAATLRVIAQELGVTREWVRQLERRALKKLRRLMKARLP